MWLQEAMKYKVKYCRIIREPFGVHCRFFLQLVMEGIPPRKHAIGAGTMAIDPVREKYNMTEKKLSTSKEYFAEAFRLSIKDPEGLKEAAPIIAECMETLKK